MTRTINNAVYPNIQEFPQYEGHVAEVSSSKNTFIQNYAKRGLGDSFNIYLKNGTEVGRVFNPKIEDSEKIHLFLENNIPKDKATEYTLEEISYQMSLKDSIVTAVESASKEVIGVNISYPAIIFPKIAQKLNWEPEGGFPARHFSKKTVYSELRAISSEYQGNGLGNILRSKQIFDSISRNYDRIILYTIQDAVPTNLKFGFKEQEKVNAIFSDGSISTLYLMSLIINEDTISKADNVLTKYLIR